MNFFAAQARRMEPEAQQSRKHFDLVRNFSVMRRLTVTLAVTPVLRLSLETMPKKEANAR